MAAPQVIYTVIDDDGDRSTTTINIPTGFSLAQIGEFGAAMATLVDAILHGRVESAGVSFSVDISALINNITGSTSDVEEIGAFKFTTADGYPVSVNLAGLDEGFVAVGTDDLDQALPAVAAFITAMENGISVVGGTISPCDVGESDIITTNSARERFRASGKRG